MTDLTERFLEVYKALKKLNLVHTPSGLANHIGVSRALVTEIIKGRTEAGMKPVQKIVQEFKQINANWLLTGDGSMFLEQNEGLQLNEPTAVYKLRTDYNVADQRIPLYNLEASAGLVELFQNHNDAQPIDTIHIPNLPKCDGAVYVTGDSMYPLLKSGDIIAYKEVSLSIDSIFFGEMYLISIDLDGEEFISVKFIQRSDKGEAYVKLVSQNTHHQAKDIPLNKVRALALVKASVRINSMA